MFETDGHSKKLEVHARAGLDKSAKRLIRMLEYPVQIPGAVEAELVQMIKFGIQLCGKSLLESLWGWTTEGSERRPDELMFRVFWESLVGKALANPGICDDCPNQKAPKRLKKALCKHCEEKVIESFGAKTLRESTFLPERTIPATRSARNN